ncbi:DUF402 domain-containing protein [Sporosalibacterium faouarense]|uniref:DUF402 domain-containing protein n=1 Tax=Sporosalibacterium faouarense TaxID=516123 RepID=UPI00192A8DB3|nr:DUF402 domain-containing protein [Sporosalibacterium faouarense]
MKRKLVDSSDWERLIKRRYKQKYIENNEFKGYVSILYIDKIEEPLIVKFEGSTLQLANDGYIWVKYLPVDYNYAVIAMYDHEYNLIQWYFDIIKEHGVNEDGKLYFDDLFLDVVVLANGEVFLLDEDELEEALENGEITDGEYNLAYKEARKLIDQINNNSNYVINSRETYLKLMMTS